MIYNIPVKLIDSPEIDISWPEDGYSYSGRPLRIDYTTDIHDNEWIPFFHEFTSDVAAFEPRTSMEEIGDAPRSVDPIFMGFADRIFVDLDGTQVALVRPGLGVSDSDPAQEVYDLPESLLAWDPEFQQLLLIRESGMPWLIIRDGGLTLSDEGMIDG